MSGLTLDHHEADTKVLANSAVWEFSPLSDRRWADFLTRHKDASIFHTPEWLAALQGSYGYQPVGFTTSQGGRLENAVVFCRVKSWLTGHRLVSLPFSDHCQPLGSLDDVQVILKHVHRTRSLAGERHLEIRPLVDEGILAGTPWLQPSQRFRTHAIDLSPPLEVLFKGMHDSCVRRKIKRAEREGLTYTAGRSQEMIDIFYNLLLLTRRRHQLPPQPRLWFENLAQELKTKLTIHIASSGQTPVASIVTLEYKNVAVYKYGCSDDRHSALGGTPLLFWKVIQLAKESGALSLDLGRSDMDEPGLSTFKERLGGVPSELCYFRDIPEVKKTGSAGSYFRSWPKKALARMPDSVLVGIGQMMYRHMG